MPFLPFSLVVLSSIMSPTVATITSLISHRTPNHGRNNGGTRRPSTRSVACLRSPRRVALGYRPFKAVQLGLGCALSE